MLFKDFSIFSSGGHFDCRSGTILTLIILVAGLMRNTVLKYFEFGPAIQLEMLFKFELWYEISNNGVCGTSKGSDQPAHQCLC